MAEPLSGLTTVVIDGTMYDAVGPGSFTLSSVERTAKLAISGTLYYTEEPVAGSIECPIYVPPGLDPTSFNDMVDVTVIIQLATGTSLVAYNAFLAETADYDAKEGTLKLVWKAQTVTVTTT